MAPAHRTRMLDTPATRNNARSPSVRAVGLCALIGLALLLPACRQEPDPPATPSASTSSAGDTSGATAPAPQVALTDVSEGDTRYRVGITYPPGIGRHQGLAVALQAYAEKARADLDNALKQAASGKQADTAFYDLTLNYTLLADTPDLVVVAADGSSFLGGAHSVPLIERFVWLPKRNERLRAESLIPAKQGWEAVSDYTREQLHAELSQRVDADELDPVERARILREAGRMIDAGTEPEPAAFRSFEPVLASDGRGIAALRFVFPPYQVGPYTDASTSVEVPAALFLPQVAAAYRDLFTTEGAPLPLRQDPLREALGRSGG